jgi:hypothetical protein
MGATLIANPARTTRKAESKLLTVTYNKDGTVKEYVNSSAGEKDGARTR